MSTKIVDRIKKLLAFATSDNPNEAAAALERAQQLMTEHGLSAEQVNATLAEEPIVEGQLRSIATASKAKDWEQYLLNRVGAAFGCELMFIRGLQYGVGKDQYARRGEGRGWSRNHYYSGRDRHGKRWKHRARAKAKREIQEVLSCEG